MIEATRRLLADAVKDWKIQNALKKITSHKVSLGKAAAECGILVWEMLELLKERNIDWTGYGKDDLEKDLALIK